MSEALGLAWQDVDLETGSVSLRRAADVRRWCRHGPRTDQDRTDRWRADDRPDRDRTPRSAPPCAGRGTRKVGRRLAGRSSTTASNSTSCSPQRTATRCFDRRSTRRSGTAAEKAGVDPKGLGTHAGRRSVRDQPVRIRVARPRRRCLVSSATPTQPRPVVTFSTKATAPGRSARRLSNSSTRTGQPRTPQAERCGLASVRTMGRICFTPWTRRRW